MIYFLKKEIKFFLKTLIIFFFVINSSCFATDYMDIEVSGNDRISTETVIMFSELNLNDKISINTLNDSVKKLYKTNYFKDVKLSIEGNKIKIEVVENPIIQSISINGVKNKELRKKLLEITKKSEKYPYLKNKIKDQRNFLFNAVRSNGFYFAKIETKLINNQNNSVDIIYNFILGERAIIKKINFTGNKIFKDSKLRNIIKSEEGKFWKIISSDKYLDERKIKLDENYLREYYKNKGYYNVNVKSSYAKNVNNEFFELNYNIEANEKFFFGETKLSLEENFNEENLNKIIKITNKIKGSKKCS